MISEYTLIRGFNGPRPPIVTLCGSTRFAEAFRTATFDLTLSGHVVLSIGCDTKTDNALWSDPATAAAIKAELDTLHLRKIDLADWVLILDIGGYIGESTRREIAYAQAIGVPVRHLTDWARPTAGEAPGQQVHRALSAAGLVRSGGAA